MHFWPAFLGVLDGRILHSPRSNIVVGVNDFDDRDFSRQVSSNVTLYARAGFTALSPKPSLKRGLAIRRDEDPPSWKLTLF